MARDGETERLILRPLRMADAAQIQELFPRWEVVRYLLNRVPWPYPPDGAHRYVREVALPAIAREDQWTWTLRLKSKPAQLIGAIDLRRGDEDNRGFWIGVDWQGKGLMSEACAWVNDYWFDTLGFRLMRVAKAAQNAASRRISEKQGMRLVGMKEKDYVCGRLPTEIWEITAKEWREWKASGSKSRAAD
jgi:[ribosomal protein S5]-alanine N-acetyltransferase